jgi:hypothetical protein
MADQNFFYSPIANCWSQVPAYIKKKVPRFVVLHIKIVQHPHRLLGPELAETAHAP